MTTWAELRSESIKIIDPRWQNLADRATTAAGVLNAENAAAEYWDREEARQVSALLGSWIARSNKLAQEDTEATDPNRASVLNYEFDRNIKRAILLGKLGVDDPPERSFLADVATNAVENVAEFGDDLGRIRKSATDGLETGAGEVGRVLPWLGLGLIIIVVMAIVSKAEK